MTITIPRHNPAYKGQIAKLFNLKTNDNFLDLTLGDGGHTQEALEVGAKVTSFDVDPESIQRAKGFVPKELAKNWTVINSNMTSIGDSLKALPPVLYNGIIIDLGPSQYQVLAPNRGFSFASTSNLDMRLDKTLGVTAKDLLAALGPKELEQILALADEPKAKQIAKAIVATRKITPLETGEQLAKLVTKAKHAGFQKTHPATQTFMALRMAVNLEREVIKDTLPQLPSLLKKGGILGIISFHSGEDRLVKQFGKSELATQTLSVIYKKPLKPSAEEINNNPRVRSALLRLFEKK